MVVLQASKKFAAFQWLRSLLIRRGPVGGMARQEGQGILQRLRVLPVRSALTDGTAPPYKLARIIVKEE
jgi:hypothetical protein